MSPLPGTLEWGRQAPRGQPVIALAMIMGVWIAARVALITFDGDLRAEVPHLARAALSAPENRPASPVTEPAVPESGNAAPGPSAVPAAPRRSGGGSAQRHAPARQIADPPSRDAGRGGALASAGPGAMAMLPDELPADYVLPQSSRPFSQGPRMSFLAASPPASADAAGDPPDAPEPGRMKRWSADGWLLLRRGDQPPALAAGTAAYGGSQAGAVLRYGLAPASALRPQAYLRVSGALGRSVHQNELALGLMIRPVKRLPIALLGEWRLQEQPGQLRNRPVVMAITQLPPIRLPMGVEADVYAQGGWAGGRDPTAFYDLSASFQRRVVRPLPGTQLSAGGGVWSGGQRGASRLDVGPRVELRGMLGPSRRRIGVRVGVDWRFRVAGKAEPGSGPALTVAAGF